MHYRNEREAKNGDTAVMFNEKGQIQFFGVLTDATAGNDYCNGYLVLTCGNAAVKHYACMCDCLHIDDLAEILKEKGLDKRPAGK